MLARILTRRENIKIKRNLSLSIVEVVTLLENNKNWSLSLERESIISRILNVEKEFVSILKDSIEMKILSYDGDKSI